MEDPAHMLFAASGKPSTRSGIPALEADLQGKSDNIGVCAFIDTRTIKRMCGTYMQEHATNMMYAANIISEDRTGFEHSICEMVKGQRK